MLTNGIDDIVYIDNMSTVRLLKQSSRVISQLVYVNEKHTLLMKSRDVECVDTPRCKVVIKTRPNMGKLWAKTNEL